MLPHVVQQHQERGSRQEVQEHGEKEVLEAAQADRPPQHQPVQRHAGQQTSLPHAGVQALLLLPVAPLRDHQRQRRRRLRRGEDQEGRPHRRDRVPDRGPGRAEGLRAGADAEDDQKEKVHHPCGETVHIRVGVCFLIRAAEMIFFSNAKMDSWMGRRIGKRHFRVQM